MPAIPQRFAIPKNEDVFEEICLKLLQLYWSRPGLELEMTEGVGRTPPLRSA